MDAPGAPFVQARARVVERLRARCAEIDDAIFARVSDQWFDRTGSGDPEYVAGLRAAGVAAVDYILDGIERWGASLAPVPAEATAQARRAARMGVGLETVLRRYVAGHAVLEDYVMQEAERELLPGQEGALREVLGIISALFDRLIAAVGTAYNGEVERGGDAALAGEDGQAPPQHNEGSARVGSGACGGSGLSRAALEEGRHERILAAIVEVVAERGCAHASVGLIVERAKVSRRTFYELFPEGVQDGLVAVMDITLEKAAAISTRAFEQEETWFDGMRAALAAMLAFFDSEPALARVCMVESLGAGPVVLKHRERVVRDFRELIVSRIEAEVPEVPPLAAEGVLASVMGVIHARMAANEQGPLVELLGPMMASIVKPFVTNEQTTLEEISRGDELARAILNGASPWVLPDRSSHHDAPLRVDLVSPSRRRARECLLFLVEHPDSSNRQIAAGIDITHQSQISKLLASLALEGLVIKRSEGAGKRNAWRLAPRGEEMARALSEQRR
jgi:AcrR family transcriptional regulator